MASAENDDAELASSSFLDDQRVFNSSLPKRPLKAVAVALQIGLVTTGLLWLGLTISKVVLASLDESGSDAWNTTYDQNQLLHFLTMVMSSVTVVLLVWWTTWAYRNLDIAGRASENPRQVTLSWIIPIIHLFIPARALEELSVGGRPDQHGRTEPRLVWYFWLAGPVMFGVRLTLLQLEVLLFVSGRLATVTTGLEWATNLLISTACFVGVVMVRKTTTAAQLW